MVRAALLALLSTGCTLLVDHELSQKAASCPDLIFLDGTPNSGGQRFHGGVSAPSFRGPAFPTPGKNPDSFGSTLTFTVSGGLELAGGLLGDQVFLRPETNYTATTASTTPGHEDTGFACAELLGASYDSLHDRTSLQLITGGCADDAITYDGGSYGGQPGPLAPALAWAGLPDGGGVFAAVLANQGQSCPETFPPGCFPPRGGAVAAGGARSVDAIYDPQGQPLWIVATEGADTRLYDASFGALIVAVTWSGPVAAVATDVGIVMRIHNGQLEAQLFDSTGSRRGNEAHFDLGDATAHGLQIARLGPTPNLRLTWIGGDGKARAASYDASVASAQRLSTPAVVCGSQGATFVAPTSSTTAAVLIGDALYLRHVD